MQLTRQLIRVGRERNLARLSQQEFNTVVKGWANSHLEDSGGRAGVMPSLI